MANISGIDVTTYYNNIYSQCNPPVVFRSPLHTLIILELLNPVSLAAEETDLYISDQFLYI